MGFEEAEQRVKASNQSPEQILEITEPFYTFQYLKEKFRKMIFTHHPDRGGTEEMAKKIIAAWEILKRKFGE